MSRREFAEQFQAIYRRLWLIAASLVGDGNEADDIVQEAAVVALRRLQTFRAGTSFLAWTSEIVRRCAANHTGKNLRRKTFAADPSLLDQESSPADHPPLFTAAMDASALESEVDDAMLRALNQLSAEARTCLLLRIVDGLSYAEIAECMGIPEGTAMSHVYRGKQHIRRQFGIVPSATRKGEE
jgi:RNA polymerase sigma-70 factor (ECF subfamily)